MRRVAFLAGVGGLLSGCQLLGGYEPFEGGDDAGAKPHRCDVLTPTKADAKGLAPMQLVKASDGTCFWVDRNEVSVEQYQRFLGERASGPLVDAERCGWKSVPSDPAGDTGHPCTQAAAAESEPFAAVKPIRCVDWCDAREFCRWAGKDLCASRNNFGTAEPPGQVDEWGIACSPTADPFPYGRTIEDGRCNIGNDRERCVVALGLACSVSAPERFPCQSTTGARDMVGNVSEWVFSCAFGDGGPDVRCSHRGGSFADESKAGTCQDGSQQYLPRNTRDRRIGFRCCAPLSAQERTELPP